MSEKRTVNRRTVRAITTIMLIAVLIFSLTAFTYSWYKNYVDVSGTKFKTAKMSLEINGYSVDSSHNVTSIDPILINKETEDSITVNGETVNVNTWGKEYHMYYIIKNPYSETSIDVDAAVTVTLDSLIGDERLGGITVDITEVDKGLITSEIENLTDERVMAIIKQNSESGIAKDTETISFSNLKNAYHEFNIPVGNYICIRLTYEMPNNMTDYSGIDLDVGVRFIMAQKGGLPGAITGSEYYVYSLDDFQAALSKYRPYDKITIKKDIVISGNLILNRPVTINLQNANLDIYGDFEIRYPYEGRFAINTERNGSLAVLMYAVDHTDEDGNIIYTSYSGGKLNISAPLSQVEFAGKNSTAADGGDIYVEDEIYIAASSTHDDTVYNGGLIINGANIYPIADERGDISGYKPIKLGSSTKLSVAKYTTVGVISCEESVIEIENRGTIGGINLSKMGFDGAFNTKLEGSYPQIFIVNHGTLTNTRIQLPINWADKFELKDDGTYEGNTRIISYPGSSILTVNVEVLNFKSDGSRDPATDDVEYVPLETYIEKVDGSADNIIIHYVNDTGLYIPGTSTDIGSSLETLLKYYMGEIGASLEPDSDLAHDVEQSLMISSVDKLKSVKIVCYGNEITSADYTYIKTMKALTYLDMSETSSTGLKTPNDAFKGLSNLSTLIPSRIDTAWGTNIFSGTKVYEIRLPDSLTSLASTNTLAGVKYVHTASRHLDYVCGTKPDKLVFVPDADTYALYNTSAFYGYVFYDAERYSFSTGEYFLRLDKDNKTAELATFRPSSVTSLTLNLESQMAGESKFNFETITVDGVVYQINVFDAYSFYKFAFSGVSAGINLSNSLTIVEKYAFGSATGITTININGSPSIESSAFRAMSAKNIYINGDANIGSYSFYGCTSTEVYIYGKCYVGDYAFYSSSAKKVHAPNVVETGYASFGKMSKLVLAYFPSLRRTNEPFYNCGSCILRLDIGIFEEGTSFGYGSNTIDYIFIHADETDESKTYDYTLKYIRAYDSNTNAPLGSQNVTIYIPTKYQAIYSGNGWGSTITLGSDVDIVDDVKDYYDPTDPNYDNAYLVPNMLYLDNNDGTVSILRYLKSSPAKTTDLFTIPKEDGSGNHVVAKILSSAYRNVTITRDELVIPETVTAIHSYAFYTGMANTSSNLKTIGRVYLPGVETVGASAFRYTRITTFDAPKLRIANSYSFSDNPEVISINAPKLTTINTSSTNNYGTCFNNCGSLRTITLGSLDDDTLKRPLLFASCSALETIIIDMSNKQTATNAATNFVYNSASSTYSPIILLISDVNYNFYNAYLTDKEFSNIVVTETTTRQGKYNKYVEVETPRYMFQIKTDNTATLMRCTSIDPDIESYELPNIVVPITDTYTFMGNTFRKCNIEDSSLEAEIGSAGYKVNNVARSAYRSVNFGFKVFNTGPYLQRISAYEFYGVTVRYMELPEVTTLDQDAFRSTTAIKTIKMPKVQTVGASAFQGCTALVEVQLPAVKTIGNSAFQGATKLTSITLGENITSLGTSTLSGCTALKEVIILANRFLSINANVFTNVTTANVSLMVKSAYLDQYVNKWGTTFGGISPFENAYIDDETGITYFYSVDADNNAQITYIDMPDNYDSGGRVVIPSAIYSLVEDGEEITKVKIHDVTGITDVFLLAIQNLKTVRTMVLPDKLENVESVLADFPYYLEELVLSEENMNYKTVDGVLYSKDGSILLHYPDNKPDSSFTVPDEVRIIAEGAFSTCVYLKSVTINNPVTIMSGAFKTSRVLESITFTSATPSTFVGSNTFTNCHRNFKIYVPAESLEAYKANVHIDTFARDSITAIVNP